MRLVQKVLKLSFCLGLTLSAQAALVPPGVPQPAGFGIPSIQDTNCPECNAAASGSFGIPNVGQNVAELLAIRERMHPERDTASVVPRGLSLGGPLNPGADTFLRPGDNWAPGLALPGIDVLDMSHPPMVPRLDSPELSGFRQDIQNFVDSVRMTP